MKRKQSTVGATFNVEQIEMLMDEFEGVSTLTIVEDMSSDAGMLPSGYNSVHGGLHRIGRWYTFYFNKKRKTFLAYIADIDTLCLVRE